MGSKFFVPGKTKNKITRKTGKPYFSLRILILTLTQKSQTKMEKPFSVPIRGFVSHQLERYEIRQGLFSYRYLGAYLGALKVRGDWRHIPKHQCSHFPLYCQKQDAETLWCCLYENDHRRGHSGGRGWMALWTSYQRVSLSHLIHCARILQFLPIFWISQKRERLSLSFPVYLLLSQNQEKEGKKWQPYNFKLASLKLLLVAVLQSGHLCRQFWLIVGKSGTQDFVLSPPNVIWPWTLFDFSALCSQGWPTWSQRQPSSSLQSLFSQETFQSWLVKKTGYFVLNANQLWSSKAPCKYCTGGSSMASGLR